MQEWTLPSGARLVRCKACVGPPPPDLPTDSAQGGVVTIDPETLRERLQRLVPEPMLDFKARSAGREPGEEG